MSKYLVIVESPTKARTIGAILGDAYDVMPSMGHVVDLPPSVLGVNTEGNFEPTYKTLKGKEKIITQLKKKAKAAEAVYIATDPDREGEAIGWHIQKKLEKESTKFYRVTFHEITAEALADAFQQPVELDMHKVNAQIARRVLDRVVGYILSPLLWKKVVRGISAGRVQSVALKFIVDRQREIAAFVPTTTYSVHASVRTGPHTFNATVAEYKGKKAIFATREEALECIEILQAETLTVKKTQVKETRRKPPSPYTTSLLQQDGFSQLHFSSQKTMLLAQKLYEGIQIDEALFGLITYMRTDSFQISPKAKEEARNLIIELYGNEFLPTKAFHHKEKKGAQLAHEAIRPASSQRIPSSVRQFLPDDEYALYELIWKRFMSSQMNEAIFQNTKIIIASSSGQLTTEGRRLIFDGFLRVMGREENDMSLPALDDGTILEVENFSVQEHTTKPPAHYNDASLVKLLEEKGIGRPSTYAPTILTLIQRNYIRREKGYFSPTELGVKVSDFLTKHFSTVVDEAFTARMEQELDKVEEGTIVWQKILHDFYPAFRNQIDTVAAHVQKEVVYEETGKLCPQCNSPLAIKWSRRGKFLSCSAFPKCRYAESILSAITCPQCKTGKLLERRNKRGQMFYGCSAFPECRFTSRTLPKEEQDQTPPSPAGSQEPAPTP